MARETLLLGDGNPPVSQKCLRNIAMVEAVFGTSETPKTDFDEVIMDLSSPWYGMTRAQAIEAQQPLNR